LHRLTFDALTVWRCLKAELPPRPPGQDRGGDRDGDEQQLA